jgi:hypothetical protein
MIITKDEISEKKNKSKIFRFENEEDYNDHYNKFDLHKSTIKPGKFFLYESIVGDRNQSVLTYPKLGLFIDTYLIDQALEVEWIDTRRTWEYKVEYEYNGKIYTNLVAEDKSELKSLILWGDIMYVYGIWDTKPDWKQLRQAYERTLWFKKTKSELRDSQINRILSI